MGRFPLNLSTLFSNSDEKPGVKAERGDRSVKREYPEDRDDSSDSSNSSSSGSDSSSSDSEEDTKYRYVYPTSTQIHEYGHDRIFFC